ncbi:PREDICTED: sodium/hydrogen exchanger 9B1-like [Polistes canadensis]|uniref:sodium/hydrogen exchanger 9B1-like n=1 Tax=Polistes canadensis TaxID=91411 RepID=UPI000718EA58|nr:PREDICTED: sodium/hydrogen exchanger 9B1-like [Polistes canadensis]
MNLKEVRNKNVPSVESEEDHQEEEEEEKEEDDNTCCSRATFCNPILREIVVTDSISKCFDTEITWANLFWLATITAMILMAWITLFFLLGETMLPQGKCFGLFVIVIFSYLLGWTLAYIPYANLPPVFGMLLAGIIVRNTNFYNIRQEFGIRTIAKIRTFCLTFIMIRAGLQLTTTPIRRHPLFVMILAIVPCTIEMLILAICTKYILDYPWNWAFMTGAIVACMSPVVTVNCMLALAERGYGEDKGLASLLSAASSIDDVHILSLFSVFYASVFGDKRLTKWWSYIPSGFRDIILGVLTGFLLGIFLAFFPHRNHKYATWYRLSNLVIAALMCTASTSKLPVSGAPYIAIIIMSFVAITGWRILTVSYNTTPLKKAAFFLWHFMQPVLVGVIGADIDFKDWSLSRFGLYCTCILIGLITRCITAILSTIKTHFSWKERTFIALAWIPKGTLQAALAPMAYQRTTEEDPEHIELALDVVRISIVAVIFLAPLGAIIMMISGPLLLNKITMEEHERERRLSYLRIRSLQPVRTRTRRRSNISV